MGKRNCPECGQYMFQLGTTATGIGAWMCRDCGHVVNEYDT